MSLSKTMFDVLRENKKGISLYSFYIRVESYGYSRVEIRYELEKLLNTRVFLLKGKILKPGWYPRFT